MTTAAPPGPRMPAPILDAAYATRWTATLEHLHARNGDVFNAVARTIVAQADLEPASVAPEPPVRRSVSHVPKHGAMAVLRRRRSAPVAPSGAPA